MELTLFKGEIVDAVAALKEQPGGDLLIYGSSALVNTLLPHGLIDEYRFMIYPLVLGGGRRFFDEGNDKITLALKRAETSNTGVTLLVCEPAREEVSESAGGHTARHRGEPPRGEASVRRCCLTSRRVRRGRGSARFRSYR